MLAGFEERLTELRRLWEEHRSAEAKLLEKETEFARREAEHKAQLELFARKLEQAERERAELEHRQSELRAIDEQTTRRAAELEEAGRQAAALKAEAQEQARAAAAQAEARQSELTAQEEAIQSLSGELEEQRAALSEREARLRAAAEQVAQLERQATQARAEAVSAADTAREELKTALSERDLLAGELERREKAQTETGRRLTDELVALNQKAAQQNTEIEQLRARLSESEGARAGKDSRAGQRVQALEHELKERDAALAEARAELARLSEEVKSLREQPATGGDGASAEALEAARKELAERESALREAVDETGSLKSRIGELEQELEEQRRATEACTGSRTLENEELAALRSELERTKAELTLAVDSCDRAHADLKKAQARASRQAGGGGTAPAFAKDAALLEMRRQRLARVKSLHRQQSNKIRVASEALRKRLEQCEQMIGLRAEIAQARQALEHAHKRVQKQRGVGRMATTLLSFAVMVSLLGAISWVVAGQVWPGKFVATATIQAQARGRELLPEERADWQAFHEQLVEDPRFIERAAESLGKRGITSLSQAGDLGPHLKEHLTTQSPGDGEISFELTGDGAERTSRILDTIVTTLAAEANAARSKRLDGGSTDIKQAALASESPIDDTRLRHTAILWGVSVGTFMVLGIVIWGRLAAAKLRYEGQMHVEHVMEDERWPVIPGLGPSKGAGSPIPSTAGRH
ncbi:MAG: hypothetical protein IT436_14785 [Phycisphaerales bacterium]|nr:hypothetical protein [Phycisphaerales bacterium]